MENCRMNYKNPPVRRGCPGECQKQPACSPGPRIFQLENMPLAMGYVPCQKLHEVYDTKKGLQMGTIFPELCKPFCGKGGGCR